jgi:hypothetical protein
MVTRNFKIKETMAQAESISRRRLAIARSSNSIGWYKNTTLFYLHSYDSISFVSSLNVHKKLSELCEKIAYKFHIPFFFHIKELFGQGTLSLYRVILNYCRSFRGLYFSNLKARPHYSCSCSSSSSPGL